MDTTLSVDACVTEAVETCRAPRFFVVSKRKFALLYIATFGLYAIYWFYRNWDSYRDSMPFDSDAGKIWPVPRAIFNIFFIHPLFREIKANAPDKPALTAWGNDLHAWALVLMLILANILDRASERSVGSPYTDILSVAMLAPLLALFLKAQEMINLSCDDPAGSGNSRFTKANVAWLVLGAVSWALVIVGLFASSEAGGTPGQGF